jgi:hypothetical protein
MLRFVNTPFSFSALEAFDICAKNFYWTREVPKAQRLGEPYSAKKTTGLDVHDAMQNYVERGEEPPIGLRKFKHAVDRVTAGALDITCEIKMGLRSDLSPCDFFDNDVAYRGQFDLNAKRADAIAQLDYKTGRAKETELQLKMYAVAGMQRWPTYNEVWGAFVYTHHDSMVVETKRKERPEIVSAINPRLERLKIARDEGNWPERQGWKCQYCPVKQCRFWNPKR